MVKMFEELEKRNEELAGCQSALADMSAEKVAMQKKASQQELRVRSARKFLKPAHTRLKNNNRLLRSELDT